MNKLLIGTILGLLSASAQADGLTVGAGKLLNNENGQHAGWLGDISYHKGPWQVTFTRVGDSYLGAEINSLILYNKTYGKFSLGGGVVLAQTYEVPAWWFTSGDIQGWGMRSQCLLCGLAAQASYKITDKVSFEVRYFGTSHFIIPAHNGSFALLSYAL